MTLVKEEKTTGLIHWKSVARYRNFTNEDYTTKNYKESEDEEEEEYQNDEDIED